MSRLLVKWRVECNELPLSEAKYPQKFTKQDGSVFEIFENSNEDDILEYIDKYTEYCEGLDTLRELEKKTFTKLGDLVDYLQTLDRNLLLVGNGADIGGYAVTWHPHVYVNNDEYTISFSNLEYDLYQLEKLKIITDQLKEKTYYDKNISIISKRIVYSYQLVEGTIDNAITIIRKNNDTGDIHNKTFFIKSKPWKIATKILNLPTGIDINNYDIQEKLSQIFEEELWRFDYLDENE